jgi:hypothetical protein
MAAGEKVLGEEYNQEVCEKTLNEHKFLPICPAPHCEAFQRTELYHEDCGKSYVYAPVQSLGCYNSAKNEWKFALPEEVLELCEKLRESDRNWKAKNCYCCCACMARDTPIALPDGIVRAIGDIQIDDVVLSGSVSGGAVTWGESKVHFSQGTEGGEEPAMVYVVYGEALRLILTSDQVLMLADGSLTTAGRLIPGQSLRGADGESLEVKLVSLGGYSGGVHHIATQLSWDGSPDGHLIAANGVVAGDYTLQMHFPSVSESLKAGGWESLPEVGTPAYLERHGQLIQLGESHTYGVVEQDVELDGEVFSAYEVEQAELPLGAQSFVTAAQAQDIVEKGKQQPITNRSGYAMTKSAIALVSGFHRDLLYYIDWTRNEPNIYAFEQYDKQVVLICGGLARMQGLSFEGMTMAIAQAVARFKGGSPKTGSGYACTGRADLYSFGVISKEIWFGEAWLGQSLNALEQLTELFDLIGAKHAEGNPLNVCEEPSIQCRIKTWKTALAGGALPECAGGPPRAPLELEQASASDSKVTLVFSQPPNPEAAEVLENYSLSPAAQITAAAIDKGENFKVLLTVSGLEEGEYTISVSDLTSTLGGKLTPDPATARFEVGA